ncbi:ABC transporter permease [Desulfoluna sp.]|uniref:ABC transporter permease n=1 Tax=Desulfoluna sp. TaxID=2045199 RepID=UPI002626BB9C|nr:ABC transporter permease [Desulfoluna sp.]
MKLSSLTRKRLTVFKRDRRAFFSLVVFGLLFAMSLGAELIANDKPFYVHYQGKHYFPLFAAYSEQVFGGFLPTEACYSDPYLKEKIEKQGWILWPPIRYSYDTIRYDLPSPPPTAPTLTNPLGTDDLGRDVFARSLYGFRLSVLFGFAFTLITSVLGITAGAIQGYYGGKVDLWGQRLMEIWSGIPMLYLLIIMNSFMTPGFWWLLALMVLFGWMRLVGVVRAEFLRGRQLDYVQAARALGVKDREIITRHILPNAMVAAMTFLPFILSGSIGILTSLDFLGFGMPPGSPSLGELLAAGKSNLHAPWLGLSAFAIVASMLTLLVLIGEGVRNAMDPKHIQGGGA